MSAHYFHLNEQRQPCGPYTAEQLRAMLAAGQLTPDTPASAPGTSDWVPLSSLLPPGPGGPPARQTAKVPARMGRREMSRIAAIVVLGLLAYGGWHWWPQLKQLGGKVGLAASPHPLARWYLFGYFHGRQQAKVDAAFGRPPKADKADLAYALKALSAPNPAPQHFAICLQGYEDGVLGKDHRHTLPSDTMDDGFPGALDGIFDFAAQ